MKYTPDNIASLSDKQVFVFGSNESGFHGAGAALIAKEKFGAVQRLGFGFSGKSFAIPTKDWEIETLDLPTVDFYVGRFIEFAITHPKLEFLVTKIGCGLAGFGVFEIAPLFFKNGSPPKNVILPKDFWNYMEQHEDIAL